MHLRAISGSDAISLARLGAKMTGLDFSPVLLAEARRIAARSGADVKFAGSDLVG